MCFPESEVLRCGHMLQPVSLSMLVLTVCVFPSSAAPVCMFGTVPCFLACGSPPSVARPEEAASYLRDVQYKKLNWIDKTTALATTPLGKCLGINGWKSYRFRVWAVGIVYQAATSWDGLRTVDIVLEGFNGYPSAPSSPQPRYLRIETIRRVWKHLDHLPSAGDKVRAEGELNWDGHGFLEIHPSKDGDVRYLSTSFPSTTSPTAQKNNRE
jgi:hypothetical protein